MTKKKAFKVLDDTTQKERKRLEDNVLEHSESTDKMMLVEEAQRAYRPSVSDHTWFREVYGKWPFQKDKTTVGDILSQTKEVVETAKDMHGLDLVIQSYRVNTKEGWTMESEISFDSISEDFHYMEVKSFQANSYLHKKGDPNNVQYSMISYFVSETRDEDGRVLIFNYKCNDVNFDNNTDAERHLKFLKHMETTKYKPLPEKKKDTE